MSEISVFISSKQSEMKTERAVLADKIRSIPFLRPILAEEWSPQTSRPVEIYLRQVVQSPIYIGLFHCMYSFHTEAEYRAAAENPYRQILIYCKHCPEQQQDHRLASLVGRMRDAHTIKDFREIGDLLPVFNQHLISALSHMVLHLQELGEGSRQTFRAETRSGEGRAEKKLTLLRGLGLLPRGGNALELADRISNFLHRA